MSNYTAKQGDIDNHLKEINCINWRKVRKVCSHKYCLHYSCSFGKRFWNTIQIKGEWGGWYGSVKNFFLRKRIYPAEEFEYFYTKTLWQLLKSVFVIFNSKWSPSLPSIDFLLGIYTYVFSSSLAIRLCKIFASVYL